MKDVDSADDGRTRRPHRLRLPDLDEPTDIGPVEPVGEDGRRRLNELGVATSVPFPRWFVVLAGACAVALVPWIVYLAIVLPSHSRAEHYRLAWVGFDAAMFVALGSLALAAIRRSTWAEPLAVCSATLLVVDAWFDVITAHGLSFRLQAVASAVLIELPLAFLCGMVARDTEQFRRRAYRGLARRYLDADGRRGRTE